MWDEDAKPREEAAVLSNRRTEPGGSNRPEVVQEGWNAGRAAAAPSTAGKGLFARTDVREEDEETASPTPPPPYSFPEKQRDGIKRTAQDAFMDDDEDYFPWALTGQEEAELATVADTAALETPVKAQKTGVYATPATTAKRKLPWLQEQPTTPTARSTIEYFAETPSRAPTAAAAIADLATPQAPANLATAKSPSPPSRFRDALSNPADSGSSLTSEALSVLSSANVPPDILSKLRSVLSKHDLRAQGVTKGRDISRLAIRAKEAKVAELQARVASLEAQREVDRAVIRNLRQQGKA